MLEIADLSYRINNHQVLNQFSLNIQPEQFFALAGENGAGKSTLIKIILDLIRNIETGRISINGQDHCQVSSRNHLTYLPEKFDVKKDVTGWQYLNFIFQAYRENKDKHKVKQLCKALGLDFKRLQDKTATYSKGMKQKLGLVSCFMLDKPLMILDEPLSGLDPAARFLFKQLLEEERAQGRTIFYSTHMLADAEEICDRFAILHHGHIVFEGSPQQCMQTYQADTLEKAYMACISKA